MPAKPYIPPATLEDLDAELAPIFAKRKSSWVPADWSTASAGFTGPFHSWDREDAEAPVAASAQRAA